jgi:hypothetical protein
VAHTYNPSYSGGSDQEDLGSKPAQINSSQNHISHPTQRRAGRVVQVVEHPPSKGKALSSNHNTTKKVKVLPCSILEFVGFIFVCLFSPSLRLPRYCWYYLPFLLLLTKLLLWLL